MKPIYLFPFLVICLFFLSARCQDVPKNGATVSVSSDIETLYQENCGSCHGRQLQQFKRLKSYDRESSYLVNVIKNGRPENGMVAFGGAFSDSLIQELSAFIKNYNYDDNQLPTPSGDRDYAVEVVVGDLEIPWGMAFLPDGDLLIAEKKGELSRYNATSGMHPIQGLPPVRDRGQGGLMDLRLHPRYEENGWLYISYSYMDEADPNAGNTAVIRARLQDDRLVDIQPIYKGIPAVSTSHHFGNRMVFDRAGYLYLSNGERGRRDEFPQRLDNSNGKIHRLYDDGRIPEDNPFYGQEGVVESIYSYGHRNPQGLALHPETGMIWEHEHGPRGGDEINIIRKGLNYGWPVISYGINYSGTIFTDITEKEGMEQPIHYYKPSIAPCGMAFVDSDIYPEWKNNLLIGSLSFEYLERLVLNGDQIIGQEKLLDELQSRVRNVIVGPDGYIYVAVEGPGRILKLLPKQ
ncbi:MAG: PQQ-dependent sugar dehydrogenase [Phaeodactylibacter sp.]|nr:PQQ-dependent sugar dehydrogenase [Phaeodactylibacter sp.]